MGRSVTPGDSKQYTPQSSSDSTVDGNQPKVVEHRPIPKGHLEVVRKANTNSNRVHLVFLVLFKAVRININKDSQSQSLTVSLPGGYKEATSP